MEKAVDSNPGSIELKMKYLDLCKGTMSPETITKEMEQLLFIHPTNMLLWKLQFLYCYFLYVFHSLLFKKTLLHCTKKYQ
jgi:hypothetical protein